MNDETTPNPSDQRLVTAYGLKGAALIEEGICSFSPWADLMIERYGDEVVPHLFAIWKESLIVAKSFNKHPPSSPPLALQEEEVSISGTRDTASDLEIHWDTQPEASPAFVLTESDDSMPTSIDAVPCVDSPQSTKGALAQFVWLALALIFVLAVGIGGYRIWKEPTRSAAKFLDAPSESTTPDTAGKSADIPAELFALNERVQKGNPDAQFELGWLLLRGDGLLVKDETNAIFLWKKAAAQNHPKAQAFLGYCYIDGRGGLVKDEKEGIRWLTVSAENGFFAAQESLGDRYYYGEGVVKDQVVGARWLRRAAEQGSARAQVTLGCAYDGGYGVPLDDAEAAKWFGLAAAQGDGMGQLFFGVNLGLGRGTTKNTMEAYKWCNLAAAQGQAGAASYRDYLAREMTPQMVAEGQRRASAFVAKQEGRSAGTLDFIAPPPIRQQKTSVGTGFFITDDGFLVTCSHVVTGARSFRVKTTSGIVPARLIKQDSVNDIAVLKIAGTVRAIPVALNRNVKLGDAVFTIGFPNPDSQGLEPKFTRGEISSLKGVRDDPRCFQISVPVQPGNSGGALVDELGNVVGVVSARLNDAAAYQSSGALPQNVNYAVKSSLLQEFLKGIPELRTGLKLPNKVADRDAVRFAAQQAAVLVIAE